MAEANPNNGGEMTGSVNEDDFVVLKNFGDLNESGVSSIAEKQGSESLEKNSVDSVLEGSSVNEKPFSEDNIFLDAQCKVASKQGYFEGISGNDAEKNNGADQKEDHVEELVSAIVNEKNIPPVNQPMKVHVLESSDPATSNDEEKVQDVKTFDPSLVGHDIKTEPALPEQQLEENAKEEISFNNNRQSSHACSDEVTKSNNYERTSPECNIEEVSADPDSKVPHYDPDENREPNRGEGNENGYPVGRQADRAAYEAAGGAVGGPAGDAAGRPAGGPAGDGTAGGAAGGVVDGRAGDAGRVAGGPAGDTAGRPAGGPAGGPAGDTAGQPAGGPAGDGTAGRAAGGAAGGPAGAGGDGAGGAAGGAVDGPAGGKFRWLIAVAIGVVLVMVNPPPSKPSPGKPVVIITTKPHLPPDWSFTWQLEGLCQAYNTSYTINQCEWKQIHPLPTNTENTVFQGDTRCVHSEPLHTINATVGNLKVPKERGNYIFQLTCTDNTGNSNQLRIDIWVNELVPPVITLPSTEYLVSASGGSVELKGLCRASQGTIARELWDFIDGPVNMVVSPTGGKVEFTIPGKYQFQYKCVDSYDSASRQYVDVTVKPSYVLGIDLGTSTTCIVYIKEDGTSEDIPIYDDLNDHDPCMPSVVAFTQDGHLLVGEKAAQQAVENPASTIYEVKRLMGRSYYDDSNHTFNYRVRPTMKSHSLKGVRAAIEIPCNGTKRLIQPELVSALILRYVANVAKHHLKLEVNDAVISVPAQFDDAQRKATKDAGLIAGLNPIKIVNEPTVAAFASRNLVQSLKDIKSGINRRNEQTVMAVVADIGGGTTDYALMQIRGIDYKVITTDGNKTLGGRDIDILLAKKLTEIFATKHPGFDLRNKKFQQKLRIACEIAKIVLSERDEYLVTVDYTDEDQVDPLPLEHMLTRGEFEGYISDIFQAMVKPLDSLMARSKGISPGSIEELYLVGGTSNIPMLKKLLNDYFVNVKKVHHEDPVQLVGRGAAAFGAVLTHLIEIPAIPRVDVTPLPIKIAVDMGNMYEVIERNRVYPCIEYISKISTFTDSQTAIVIKVYEGEGKTEDECHFLGEFELSGIPALPKGVPEISATFRIDSNGILSVRARYGEVETGMKLDVYSKSGSMTVKAREKLTTLLNELVQSKSSDKCSALEIASPMEVIPPKPRAENVLKLFVDSKYDSVLVADPSSSTVDLPALGMVAITGSLSDISVKESDLDIVLVIDKSGSMEGIPIATIKDVIERLIDVLKPNHRLGIVTYDSDVYQPLALTFCTDPAKQSAHNIVRQISALGATNLYDGLLTGLKMAYNGGRRSRVLLFTDGYANRGVMVPGEIIRGIVQQTVVLSSLTSAQVTLSTFGYLGNHDHELLSSLASNVGSGSYNYLDKSKAIADGFGHVLGDAINTVAENIRLSVIPLRGVQIKRPITNFTYTTEPDRLTFNIPSTANQQARHILLELTVPSCNEPIPHDSLFRVELTYMNTITEREEGSEDYLFVARTPWLDSETRSREVDEQLNRVFVAERVGKALEHVNQGEKEQAVKLLKEAIEFVSNSISKGHTLSLCLRKDLDMLLTKIIEDMKEAKKFLKDSLNSHWEEKGGKSSCYLTKNQLKLITILKRDP